MARGHGACAGVSVAVGKLVFGIFAALAEFERELISEQTVTGLIAACSRQKRRSPVQNEVSQDAPGYGQRGSTGNQGQRSLRRIWDDAPDALPPCVASG